MIPITSSNIFAIGNQRWNEKTLPQKTCKSFKLQFYQDQKSTKKAHPQQSLSGIGFHQSATATIISDELYARITAQQTEESARAEAKTAERLADQQMQEQMKKW